ncbi:aminopeptidase [Diaphorobacter aerolatus]|uniref:Aminopeptidase n=1 Tax=Diaphorobacter aerolatus TaxID=1288495 RepID=A0A7H0GP63_9BURK|nr:aminopeptidase [Diaphorobacter aerolatus]QNP50079.1 aminopeptidase [Diaphorobacter aerolatus]
MKKALRLASSVLTVLALGACASSGDSIIGYYWQSFRGHMDLMGSARPLNDWINDTSQKPALRERLELALRARQFAIDELGLPDNASYRRYAQLGRSAAVWNVVGAPPYSLKLHTWCFPVTGCIGYRGYFAEADAKAEAERLAQSGLEVSVYPVPAYSTLGYSNWLGGDPLLNTFVGWPEGDFVRLLFHELAHQVVYASGDTAFNESYATAVERLGVDQWLREHSTDKARAEFATSEKRRAQFRALTRDARAQLSRIYTAGDTETAAGRAELHAQKQGAMQAFREAYARQRERWINEDGVRPEQLANLDRWVMDANNASFGAQGAYDDLVPAFIALFEQQGRNWQRFHAAVQALADEPQDARLAQLRALVPTTHIGSIAQPPAADR